jgi:SNF2 family DNA or RNA helicase
VALRAGYEPPYSSISIDYGAQRHVRFRIGREAPSALRRLARQYFADDGRWKLKSFARVDVFVSAAKEIDPGLRIYEDVLTFVAEIRDAERRAKIIDRAFPDGVRSPAFDDLLRASLYDYQKEGAIFAARAGRSLIADEMGLGKTIQAIAAAELMARHLGVERVLIVCPTSLKSQWSQEIHRFTDFIDPFRLGPTYRFLDGHQSKDENGRVTGYRDLDRVTATLTSVVLRRRKKDVLAQLPERLEKQFLVAMTPQQREHHAENEAIVARIAAKWRKIRRLRF